MPNEVQAVAAVSLKRALGFNLAGYGQQCALFAPRLADHYDVSVSAFYGLEGARLQYGKVTVLPGMGQTYGNQTLLPHAQSVFEGNLRGGLVVTLMDVWVLDAAIVRRLNCACWVPVDHDPAPPRVVEFFRHSGAIPIAMSPFGREQLAEFSPLYVPHGIPTDDYKPIERSEARKASGMDQDRFIVGMVAANKGNPSRKNFAIALQAFKAFSDRHDDALLYLHTDVSGGNDGVRIEPLMAAVGLDEDKVVFPNQYRIVHHPFQAETMATIYSSLDVLLAPSAGEGFGIPVLEANACGVPAIVSDFSAQPDVLSGGWTVEGERVWSVQESWQFRPSTEDIVRALDAAYTLPAATRRSVAEKCRKGALRFDADRVLREDFLPALAEVERRYEAREPVELKAAA